MPGCTSKLASRSFPRIANHSRTGVIGSSSTLRSRPLLVCPINKSRRHVGILLNLTCERTQRPGSGCTNIGATFLQALIDHTRSTQIFTGRSKTCCRGTRLNRQPKRSCRGVRRGERLIPLDRCLTQAPLQQAAIGASLVVVDGLRPRSVHFHPVAHLLNQIPLFF